MEPARPLPTTNPDSSPPAGRRPRWWWRLAAVPLLLLLVVAMALMFIDEPLRAYAERELNRRVQGYTFHIGKLDFHPIGLSLDLEQVSVVQTEHPDPPVAQLTKWHASVHWGALLSGRLVSDHMMDHPVLHITRPQAPAEAHDDVPPDEKGWQEAVLAIYPLQINEFRIEEGELAYRESATSKPLHLSAITFKAGNIRNVRSKADEYPSPVHLEAVVFEQGRLTLDGHADFLAQPSTTINADITLNDIALKNVLPLTAQHQVQLSQGVLAAQGHVEYSPSKQEVRLKTLALRDVKLDYVHAADVRHKEKQREQKVAHAADKAAGHPTFLLRIDQGTIDNSEFGFVNQATDPHYRVFLSGTDIYLENWSNQLREGTAVVRLRGMFMGSGATQLNGAFRPETKSPDFDLDLKVWKTHVPALNNLLRAYGGLDLASGIFSVFTQMTVKKGSLDGYVKPIFKDVKAYDPGQDADADKGLLKRIYEKLVNVAAKVMKNTPRGEVATKADLSGPVDNPQASTWELIVTLVQNAFFEAVLPGFEGMPRSGKR